MLLYSNKYVNIRSSLVTLICPVQLFAGDLQNNGCAFSKTKRLIISVAVSAVEEGQLIFPLLNGDLLLQSVSAPPCSSGAGSKCQL